MKKGYLCPICKTYSDKETDVKRLPGGKIRFTHGCGHVTVESLQTIGYWRAPYTDPIDTNLRR